MRIPAVFRQAFIFSLLCLGQVESAVAVPAFPLQVAGSRLLDATGQDVRLVGDAPWTLIVALTAEEADAYLAARKAAGFNAILVELIEPEFSGPRNRNGDLPFPEGKEFTAPSPAYFRHATAVLDLARKHGFIVLLAPAYLGWHCESNGWCREMLRTPDAVLESYGRFVGELLAPYPNVVWVHGGDADANRYQAMAKVEAVYRGINAVAPGGLHTAHCARNLSAVDCYDRPWLTMNTTYSDCEQTPARIRLDRERVGSKPSLYIEGRYEEEKSTPQCLRSQLWWSYLGGSVGHVFGNKRIWRFESDWRSALDTPGARAMTVASRLLASPDRVDAVSLDGSRLVVNRLATAWDRMREPGYGTGIAWSGVAGPDEEIPVAQSPGVTIAYLPFLTRFAYTRPGDALCWVDPRTGAVKPESAERTDLRSPDAGDWLFVAEAAPGICARKSL